ncbi:TraR/DksA family transcriptional regulator [Streptomyces sp. TP-A0874]|uniref:TraR/DksA family transcriptional regulator n=1 Tax=Streptomyces sp. TP-A0874 TaxID=549819 RepID=UPI000A51D701|nr:TraR/DksA family transcriptional regulator [Streptomyces sp. TP-A0874]
MRKTGAKSLVTKKTPGAGIPGGVDEQVPAGPLRDAVPQAGSLPSVSAELPVRADEEPWAAEEVAAARALLRGEVERLRAEISASGEALAGLMRDSGDGAGDDQADSGAKNITREHEMALTANAREMLEQNERALLWLDAGTYGRCESCAGPIGKARMQAFPRATLCVDCKQRQERR